MSLGSNLAFGESASLADSLVAPSTTEKKSRARTVFGDIVAEVETKSLDYSPSPWKAKAKELPDLSALLDDHLNQSHQSSATNPFLAILANDKENPEPQLNEKEDTNSEENVKVVMETETWKMPAARNAKQPLSTSFLSKHPVRGKDISTSRSKVSWKDQTNEAKVLSARIEDERKKALRMETQIASHQSRTLARTKAQERQARLNEISKETKFKSDVYRNQKKTLKEEEDLRRRQSVAARAKLRENHRVGEQRLKAEKLEREDAILEERHAGSVAIRATKRQNMNARRQSYIFRGGDARRIREIYAKSRAKQLKDEQETFELKRLDKKKMNEYEREVAEERRHSLEKRGHITHQQRVKSKQESASDRAKEVESLRLKAMGEKDSEAYQRDMEEKRRRSLAQRNQYARSQREAAAKANAVEKQQEHESYVLKWAGEKDSQEHVEKLERIRRQSLAGQRAESVRHDRSMQELKSLAREKEAESYILKWAGENDSKEYLAKLDADRRESLQARGRQVVHNREVEKSDQKQVILEIQANEVMRASDHRAKVAYEQECSERDRKSLEYRRMESRLQRMKDSAENREKQAKDEENFALETKAREDVAGYVSECKQRRRMSLAVRAKERRRHEKWSHAQHVKKTEEINQQVHNRLMDRQYTELAKQKERNARARKELKRAGISFDLDEEEP